MHVCAFLLGVEDQVLGMKFHALTPAEMIMPNASDYPCQYADQSRQRCIRAQLLHSSLRVPLSIHCVQPLKDAPLAIYTSWGRRPYLAKASQPRAWCWSASSPATKKMWKGSRLLAR